MAQEPEIRLFLSVDVTGSTAYKQQSHNNTQHWLEAFIRFYEEFSESLEPFLSDLLKEQGLALTDCQPFEFWKGLGDELLFYVVLAKRAHTSHYMMAFRDAVISYNGMLQRKKLPLRLKATAWLAGFPVGNARIPLPNIGLSDQQAAAKPQFDFIGPQFDIGFRLTKLSDRRKFVLSVELALVLVGGNWEGAKAPVFFEGATPLKGVLDDKPYPVFWIDMGDEEKNYIENLIVDNMHHPSQKDAKKFCEKFIEMTGPPLIKPFFPGEPRPDWYDAKLAEINERWLALDPRHAGDSGDEKSKISPKQAKKQFNDLKAQSSTVKLKKSAYKSKARGKGKKAGSKK
ncbi:MAG: hypothetical protein HQL69_23380 [Magnetococcales bacterium]|nr:hypothetical protein [Magnetococcales bacterium]